MKAIVPEIAWHNKSPVFGVDIQPAVNKGFYRAATCGGDSHVVIWHLIIKEVENETTVSVDFAADLDRHIKAVNVVKFSNDSKFLASGDDDAVIIIWSLKEDQSNCNNSFTNEEGNKENWSSVKVLRGHKDDIYDLCWSPTSSELFSGSVDNTACLWNVSKGQNTGKVGEHNGFVQGVAWDPKNKYLATLCSDRAFRLFDADTRKVVAKVIKAKVNKALVQEEAENEENLMRLFHDDTVKTFFRRLCFSPDGNLLFVPCGIFQDVDCEAKPPKDVTYIFLKSKPERPVFHLPSRDEYTVAVRCCPILFRLNPSDSNLFKLPYRIIFAIASRRSIVFYDTQQLQPFGIVSDIHYATLTDISWSPDGRLLLASSSDGYCTIVTFNKGELGVPYSENPPDPVVLDLYDVFEDLGVEPLNQSGFQKQNGSVDGLKDEKQPEIKEDKHPDLGEEQKETCTDKIETSVDKPFTEPSVDKPTIETSVDKPTIETSVDKPPTETLVDKPPKETSVDKPFTEPSVEKPHIEATVAVADDETNMETLVDQPMDVNDTNDVADQGELKESLTQT